MRLNYTGHLHGEAQHIRQGIRKILHPRHFRPPRTSALPYPRESDSAAPVGRRGHAMLGPEAAAEVAPVVKA